MYNIFDVIKKDSIMYLYLGKYKIYKDNKLIENYRYNDIDSHIYVEISKIPKIENNNIIFSDIYMFKFLKHKILNVDIVERLSLNLYDSINLKFVDKSFEARKIVKGIDSRDVKLLDSINEEKYVDCINMVNNVKDLSLEFMYNKRSKVYGSIISYYNKKYQLKFINDDFIFNILTPLISELINNNACRFKYDKNNLTINTEKSYNIVIRDFQEEIILYLLSKFRIDENIRRI